MKTIKHTLVILFGLLIGATFPIHAQPARHFTPGTNSPYALLQNPALTNLPGAISAIQYVLTTPAGPLSMPVVNATNNSGSGTYWTLHASAPLPANFFPTLPVYQLNASNRIFLIDDRSVDYAALQARQAAENATNGFADSGSSSGSSLFDTNGLWLEVPANALAVSNQFNVVIRNTIAGKYYDVLTKPDLLLPAWTMEKMVRAASYSTPVTLSQHRQTNLFVWVRESIIPIYQQPLSQWAAFGDTVTFTVVAQGSGLTYQWIFKGTNIPGATASSYTINGVRAFNAGDYACIITSAAGSETSMTATLSVWNANLYSTEMHLFGQRQDYTFRNGITYFVGSTVQLYGQTVIEGGAIIKFGYYYSGDSLKIMGDLKCKTAEYAPAILTSVDDNSFGSLWGQNTPQPQFTGAPFLDLTEAANVSINNLHFRYADMALSTPYHGRLDVWNCQFFQCFAAIINEFGGEDSCHNVLFAGCYDAVAAFTNSYAIEMEHVTADVYNLWYSSIPAYRASLTNCILLGNLGTTAALSTKNTALNPPATNFQASGAGQYYLTADSSLHKAGTTNISFRLLTDLPSRTTYAPVSFPALTTWSGSLVLSPQVKRYVSGSPDLGYYYAALDYTVSDFILFGTLNVLPGTAIGVRAEASEFPGNNWMYFGFDLREGSSFVSHGQPGNLNVVADVQLVQEQYQPPANALFVPNYQPDGVSEVPPSLDLRFNDLYAAVNWYHVWAGYDEYYDAEASPISRVNWRMADCTLHAGEVCLGPPDDGYFSFSGQLPWGYSNQNEYGPGSVTWQNNLFDRANVILVPTYFFDVGVTNCDLSVSIYNNLFRENWFVMAATPSSAGDWTIRDNVFERVEFGQLSFTFQGQPLPLDLDYNAYRLLEPAAIYWSQWDTNRLTSGPNSGLHDFVLDYPLTYTNGPFGRYYLDTVSPLWQAGSRTATDAGLAQYTTFINQLKDASNQPVNIGLHYVATANSQLSTNNSQLPLDSDGDGVPDYVEVEHGTDPGLAMTDGTTPDVLNAVYDDVDLSGNGLVGRIKKALGLSPFCQTNPLTLKQVITGEEPDIATFEVPVSYLVITNVGELALALNGRAAQFQECSRATNGNCLLKWNTTFDPPGQHYPAAQIRLNGKISIGTAYAPDTTILHGVGKIFSFFSINACQFNPVYTEYETNSGGILYAKTPMNQAADYSIELKTETGIHIRTITGSTANGVISENWDLTDDNGNTYTNGGDIEARYAVIPQNSGTVTNKVVIHPQDAGFVLDGNFTIAFTTDDQSLANFGGALRFAIQHGVVDPLISPLQSGGVGSTDPYNSTFNDYSWSGGGGVPGYISGPADVTALTNNLADLETRNFYFDGHGNPAKIGNNLDKLRFSFVDIDYADIAGICGNNVALPQKVYKGLRRSHPYRFVFLNCCETADDDRWHNAFGIYKQIDHLDLAVHPGNAQAFVGWVNSPRIPYWSSDWYDIAVTYALLNQAWMDGIPLDDCLDLASREYPFSPTDQTTHLDWPLDTDFIPVLQTWWGFPNNFKLKIYGYAGLKKHGYDANPRHDSSWYYQDTR